MADPSQDTSSTSAFPNPPSFYQQFTLENISQYEALVSPQAAPDPTAHNGLPLSPTRLLELPTELRFLQPPTEPVDGRYRCFGALYNLQDELPSLEEQNIEQLYTPPLTPNGTTKNIDRALILKRLAKSLLLNFLEMVGIMSFNPEQYSEKIMDLRTLFINFHHLLNEYRPHQARESLILMMQDQLDSSREETEGILRMKKQVESVLEGLVDLGSCREASNPDGVMDKKVKEQNGETQQDVWEELRQHFE